MYFTLEGGGSWERSREPSDCDASLTPNERRLNGSVLSYHATHGRFGKAIDKYLSQSSLLMCCQNVSALLFLL